MARQVNGMLIGLDRGHPSRVVRWSVCFSLSKRFRCSEREGAVRASDVMSTIVARTTSETTIEGIFQLMIKHRLSGIPVVVGDAWRAGMVTKNDSSRRVEIGVCGIEGRTIAGPLYPVL